MNKSLPKAAELITKEKFASLEKYLLHLRHLFAYEFAVRKISPESLVLEVGSGEGYGTSFLASRAKEIVGLDVDEKAVSYASNKYNLENCTFKFYDGKKIPFRDNTFDILISFQVVEHVPNEVNYLAEAHRVLKKGGMFILTTPNRAQRLRPGQKPWNRLHLREYLASDLEHLLKGTFSKVVIEGVFGKKDIQEVEFSRIKRNARLIALDPLNIRRYLPLALETIIIKILRKIISHREQSKNVPDCYKQYTTQDYYLSPDNLEKSLDLWALCEK